MEIKNIEIEALFHHPKNPRKKIGDVTELAESIKQKGIMQNLTVCPGGDGFYYVLIGNRRLEGANAAGLSELPCAIVEGLSEAEQVEMMLLENMQRSDLTCLEEAEGFQYLIDLGNSIADIAEKTGFSESTVRRRVKLMEFPSDEVESAIGRGATLFDFAEIDKIEDEETKQKLLKTVGTNNFDWDMKVALRTQKEKEKEKIAIQKIKSVNPKIKIIKSSIAYTEYKKAHYFPTDEIIKDDFVFNTELWCRDDISLYCNRTYFYVYEYYSDEEVEEAEDKDNKRKAEQEERERKNLMLREKFKLMYEQRKKFVSTVSATRCSGKINCIALLMLKYCDDMFGCYSDVDRMLGLEEVKESERAECYRRKIEKIGADKILLMYLLEMIDSEYNSYYDYYLKYQDNELLDDIYALLGELEYCCSDEESSLINGSHELYANDSEE